MPVAPNPLRKPPKVQLGSTELIKIGARNYDWRTPYRFALSLSWPAFFLGFALAEVVINLTFALLFVAGGFLAGGPSINNARPGSVLDAFFFSVETFSTVGYGVMSPGNLFGHLIASIDVLVGVAFTAVITGLIFVRFSKPQAQMVYAANPVISQHNGKPTLMIRLASTTTGVITGAKVRLNVLLLAPSSEGRNYRVAKELVLVRDYLPLLLLAWTVMHEIDEASPLFGLSADALAENDARLLLTIEARDHAIGAQVVDVKTYEASDVLFGMAYEDIVTYSRTGGTQVDLRRISSVERDPASDAPAANAPTSDAPASGAVPASPVAVTAD